MSDKGIRLNVNRKFVEMLPQRAELGNTRFRKEVICYAMDEFSITLASAATHYNHAFKVVRAAHPELVADLGRAEDKKGGRKPKAKTPPAVPAVMLLLGYTPRNVEADVAEIQQTEFRVCVKRTGEVVAQGLSFEAATALVTKAQHAKKSKLYWV